MIAILSLLVVLVVSLIVVRVATVALALTGMSKQMARFQARSAFTGAGFTTTESESVVKHPVRRRIIMLLMLLGNAGIVTAISSLMLSLVGTEEEAGVTGSLWFRMTVLAVGLAVLWTVANSIWLDHRMSKIIGRALKRWTDLDVRDYAGLLRLQGGYTVTEMLVDKRDWLAERPLAELHLSDEGVLVLGVQRENGTYLGAPRGDAVAHIGDTLILYGPEDRLLDLDERRAGAEGNWRHHIAIGQQQRLEAEEKTQDVESDAEPANAVDRPLASGDEGKRPTAQ